MIVKDIQAANLKTGMILIPKLRTMRYKEVEDVSTGLEFFVDPPKTMFDAMVKKVKSFKGQRNHERPIVTVSTDCGKISFDAAEVVKVLVSEHEAAHEDES